MVTLPGIEVDYGDSRLLLNYVKGVRLLRLSTRKSSCLSIGEFRNIWPGCKWCSREGKGEMNPCSFRHSSRNHPLNRSEDIRPAPPITRLMCSHTRFAKMREAARQFPSGGANDNQESGDSPPWHPPSPTRSRQQAPPFLPRSTPAPSRPVSTACRRRVASGSSSCC